LKFTETVSLAHSPENEPEAKETPETNMMQEALNLAAKGFRVFPVYEPTAKGCSCKQNESCSNAGKHPRVSEWQKVATTDKAQIKSWWSKWQNANIGIATGKGSNVIVLDVDANKGGDVSLSELFEDSDLPDTLTAKTGNGFHFFFQTVESVGIKNSVVKIG
jgi:putative DNA primase/helicase